MTNHEIFYKANKAYTSILESKKIDIYAKYIKFLCDYGVKVLDVGCGTGVALDGIKKNIDKYGIEISQSSINKCKQKKLKCSIYDGRNMPFKDEYFDTVGSYNVLEHTDDPIKFLDENLRVLKKRGHLIIICPNFLAISNNYHHHTRGLFQKIKNLLAILKRLLPDRYHFEKMDTIVTNDFHSDDDACNITNPIDILRWSKEKNLQLKYWSAFPVYKKGVINCLDFFIGRIFLGSSFFVFKK